MFAPFAMASLAQRVPKLIVRLGTSPVIVVGMLLEGAAWPTLLAFATQRDH
jgi:hypothetical protein